MAITLAHARYGKAETRVVRVRRDGEGTVVRDDAPPAGEAW